MKWSYKNLDFYSVTRIIYDNFFKLFVFSGIVVYGLTFFSARVRGSNMYNSLASTNHIILL